MHPGFTHPASDKLFAQLDLALLWATNQKIRETLTLTSKRCDACQRFSHAPVKLRASLLTERKLVVGE